MRILFTLIALLSANANAAVCSRTVTFTDGSVLTAAQLNSEFNAITNCANSLDNTNLSVGANISPLKIDASIAAAAGAISRSGVTGALSVNVDNTSIEISSNAIQLKDLGVTTQKIAANAVTTAKIADSNVTTAKIADLNVTRAKLEALGNQTSSSIDIFSTASPFGTLVDIIDSLDLSTTNITITTTGRPVMLMALSSSTNPLTPGQFDNCTIAFLRGALPVGVYGSSTEISPTPAATIGYLPVSSLSHIDTPPAGTYTYKMQASRTSTTRSCSVQYLRLVGYEL